MRFIIDFGWFKGEPLVLLDARLLSYSPGFLTLFHISTLKFMLSVGLEI